MESRAARTPFAQELFPELSPVALAVKALATAGAEERGAIFTRREVVDFILDLAGYRADRPLADLRLLEPSFGGGDFLLAAIERLVRSVKLHQGELEVAKLSAAIRGVELHSDTFERTRNAVRGLLMTEGLTEAQAATLCSRWLVNDDFLLTEVGEGFDFVVGNPPYIRQELLPDVLVQEYRRRFVTVYDRADIYIPFIERSLSLLSRGGVVAFICADRWMKNRYGGPLRALIAEGYHLRSFVDMVDTPAFHSDVIAYPGIFVIAKEAGQTTRFAERPEIDARELKLLAEQITSAKLVSNSVREVELVASGAEPWLLHDVKRLALVRRLEGEFPTLEDVGCKVGIGVATGADDQFIGPFDSLDVEEDRKLPLVMTRDIVSGAVAWRGQGVVNPFSEAGGLVDLVSYPRLRTYLEARKAQIAKRHVAQKAPTNWYRTIDRIYPALTTKPKLLIPDIKGEAQIVFDEGRYYPHHNLYFVTSDGWDLRALQAVLLSGIARLFVGAYSTKMRGGYLRFQAQYLRRIRVPRWEEVSPSFRAALIDAAERRDLAACNKSAAMLYQLTKEENALLLG